MNADSRHGSYRSVPGTVNVAPSEHPLVDCTLVIL